MSGLGRYRIYVAGAYSAADVISVLGNMRRGIHAAYHVWRAGYAPFVPWFDFQFGLIGPATLQDYYDYSMAWLEAADAVVVVPEGSEQSNGTQAELTRARELGLPIFAYSTIEQTIERLNEFFHTNGSGRPCTTAAIGDNSPAVPSATPQPTSPGQTCAPHSL